MFISWKEVGSISGFNRDVNAETSGEVLTRHIREIFKAANRRTFQPRNAKKVFCVIFLVFFSVVSPGHSIFRHRFFETMNEKLKRLAVQIISLVQISNLEKSTP